MAFAFDIFKSFSDFQTALVFKKRRKAFCLYSSIFKSHVGILYA